MRGSLHFLKKPLKMWRIFTYLTFLKYVTSSYEYDMNPSRMGQRPGMPLPSVMFSQGGGDPEIPPVYQPESQAYVVSHQMPTKPPHEFWEEETSRNKTENKNCLLCEQVDSGNCRNTPSCIFCETTVTALCDRSTPCLRCSVIKNPFFECRAGEKYMDECDSCRCVDGRTGWCTNMYCEFRPLYLYAMKLSDGELYWH